jgi:hypothetical protein
VFVLKVLMGTNSEDGNAEFGAVDVDRVRSAFATTAEAAFIGRADPIVFVPVLRRYPVFGWELMPAILEAGAKARNDHLAVAACSALSVLLQHKAALGSKCERLLKHAKEISMFVSTVLAREGMVTKRLRESLKCVSRLSQVLKGVKPEALKASGWDGAAVRAALVAAAKAHQSSPAAVKHIQQLIATALSTGSVKPEKPKTAKEFFKGKKASSGKGRSKKGGKAPPTPTTSTTKKAKKQETPSKEADAATPKSKRRRTTNRAHGTASK